MTLMTWEASWEEQNAYAAGRLRLGCFGGMEKVRWLESARDGDGDGDIPLLLFCFSFVVWYSVCEHMVNLIR